MLLDIMFYMKFHMIMTVSYTHLDVYKRQTVSASWGFYIGHFHVSSGMIIIPLLIGIIWKVMYPSSMGAWFLIGLGILCILITIIMGVRIRFTTTSLFDFILMFGLTAIGFGLILKCLIVSNRE